MDIKNNQTLFDVSDEVVVITGVSGGLGLEYAYAFLQSNAKVVGLDIKESQATKTLSSEYPKNFLFSLSDVTNKSSIKESLDSTIDIFGKVTVLINNAAIDSPPSASKDENGPFENYPEKSWDKIMDVNLKSIFLCSQVFGSKMAEQNHGSIINISSIYGLVSPDQTIYDYRRKNGDDFYKPIAYSVSKSGVLNLTRYLSTYWAKKNVRVNSLTLAGVFNDQDQDFLDAYTSRIPIGRMAKKTEYNGAVIFLASNASKYMTGSNLVIDGGWTAI
jgi:NAD(P)-dependent dehydrogenase (short-subunit alcohol dehydrogenase family)